ncbi:Ribokinase-like protein [Xylariomycetidae sp. FL0641]|nr:Ribokinase-like protein [Xylariomycetidae sp. FL0641]
MAAKTPTITVLGSLNIDLVAYVPHHPQPGETLTSSSFAVSPGGKGANQAVACAKLSRTPSLSGATAAVRMLGAVGADTYGETLRRNLGAHGVDVSGLAVPPGPAAKTGVAIILVDEPTGQNRIVLSPEANHALAASAYSSLASLSGGGGGAGETSSSSPPPDLLILQLEIPLATVLAALRVARDHGVPALLNPAPALPGLPAEAYRGLAHLVLNETEAAILGGVAEAELEREEGLRRVACEFRARGVRNVIITLGGRGVFYLGEGGQEGLVPAEKAKVVDTTAAGDTFVGCYALEAVSGNFDIGAAVRKANRAAAKTVERLGAQDSIPWRDEL